MPTLRANQCPLNLSNSNPSLVIPDYAGREGVKPLLLACEDVPLEALSLMAAYASVRAEFSISFTDLALADNGYRAVYRGAVFHGNERVLLGLEQRTLDDLDFTNGKRDLDETASGFLSISGPQTRAVEKMSAAPVTILRFRYRGPSTIEKPLASGETRRQIGLKLRANNSCNVLYVMWRIEPEEELVVSIKSNPV